MLFVYSHVTRRNSVGYLTLTISAGYKPDTNQFKWYNRDQFKIIGNTKFNSFLVLTGTEYAYSHQGIYGTATKTGMWTGSTRVLFSGTIKIKTASLHGTYSLWRSYSHQFKIRKYTYKGVIRHLLYPFENIVPWTYELTVLNHKTYFLSISWVSDENPAIQNITDPGFLKIMSETTRENPNW